MNGSTSSEPTARRYLVGLALALVLTIIPFGLVYAGWPDRNTILVVIAVAAVAQILVHLRYFLGLSFTQTPRENLLALAFACLLIFIMVGGSLWIMFDLHYRMMP